MAAASASPLKVHSAIARALVDNGVDTMFGLVGDANLYMVDSFVREYRGNFIAAANEVGATLMALGFAAISGKVGVATVTLGPGLVNTLAGLTEAAKGSTPIVLLCGDSTNEDRDGLSKIVQRDFVVPTGAGFEQLRSPETLSQDIAQAFRRAIVERRPIALNMPVDFQWCDVDYRTVRSKVPNGRAPPPSGADLDDAIGIIAAAKRPIVLAGRGATDLRSKASISRLAARIDAMLATTLKAKDLFRDEQYGLGIFGTLSSPDAVEAIMASDCIIAFGASLNGYTSSHGAFLKGKRLVQVNLEQAEIGKHASVDAGVVGDPALVADTIIHWLDQAEIAPSGFRDETRTWPDVRSPLPAGGTRMSKAGTVDIHLALARLDEAVPEDRVFVTDAGRFLGPAWVTLRVPDPRSFLPGVNFGAIGMGLSQAIGASFAARGRPTLLVTGDGGFMLGGLAEFNTAVRYGRDLIVVVCNDGSYGAEHVQLRNRNMDPGISMFDWPDFGPVAVALGGAGITVRTLEDLDAAAEAVRQRDRPLLIDLKLDPDNMPVLSQ